MEPVAIVSFHAPTEPPGWADEVAGSLVADRLAAGVNINPGVRSVFWWKGDRTHADELLVEVTTRQSLIGTVTDRVLTEHPYELPGVRAMLLDDVNDGYHRWVIDSTNG
jgi:periplasmic divalent cation tolerance protein